MIVEYIGNLDSKEPVKWIDEIGKRFLVLESYIGLNTQDITYRILEHDTYQYPPVCLWDNFKIVCSKMPSNWIFTYNSIEKFAILSPNEWLDDKPWIYGFWDAYHRNGDGSFELEELAHKVYEKELRIIWEECGKGWVPSPFEQIISACKLGAMAATYALETKPGKKIAKFVDKNIATPLFSMAGISPNDQEYQTGKLILKTAAYIALMKKNSDIANDALIKYYPKQHYYKTGIQYKVSGTEKTLEQIDLNKVSLNKAQNLLVKRGYTTAEAQQLESFFADTAKLQLKPEVVAASRKMDKLDIGDPRVIKELTKDGSLIEDWKKFSTKPLNINGNKPEIHYYKNIITQEINLKDFKIKFIKPKK